MFSAFMAEGFSLDRCSCLPVVNVIMDFSAKQISPSNRYNITGKLIYLLYYKRGFLKSRYLPEVILVSFLYSKPQYFCL